MKPVLHLPPLRLSRVSLQLGQLIQHPVSETVNTPVNFSPSNNPRRHAPHQKLDNEAPLALGKLTKASLKVLSSEN